MEECRKAYRKEFKELGCVAVFPRSDYRPKFLELEILDSPAEAEIRRDVVNLILTLEPESLRLWGAPDSSGWESISFVGILSNLEELTLTLTLVTDLTPLKGLTKLRKLSLLKTPVTDLTPLEGLPKLETIYEKKIKTTD